MFLSAMRLKHKYVFTPKNGKKEKSAFDISSSDCSTGADGIRIQTELIRLLSILLWHVAIQLLDQITTLSVRSHGRLTVSSMIFSEDSTKIKQQIKTFMYHFVEIYLLFLTVDVSKYGKT